MMLVGVGPLLRVNKDGGCKQWCWDGASEVYEIDSSEETDDVFVEFDTSD